jgi:hypothetical protein
LPCEGASSSRSTDGTASVRNDIVDVAEMTVTLEEKFVDLTFVLGQIEGMKPEQIHDGENGVSAAFARVNNDKARRGALASAPQEAKRYMYSDAKFRLSVGYSAPEEWTW